MTSTAMAGTNQPGVKTTQAEVKTTAAAQKQKAGSDDKAAGKKDAAGNANAADAKDKVEVKELFGRIKKVNKDSLEIETALAEDTAETKDGKTAKKDEKTAKKDGQGNAEEKKTAPDTKTAENAPAGSEILKLVLDGKTVTIHLEKDTKFFA